MKILTKFNNYDLNQLTDVLSTFDEINLQLSKYERKYKIRNYSESANLRKFPMALRHKVRLEWLKLRYLSSELDDIFLEDT